MRKTTLIAMFASIALLAPIAAADVLWDQSDVDAFGPGFFNSESGSPPFGMTNFVVNDVTVGSGGWTIESVSIYFSALDPDWGLGITQGYLHVWPKVGPLPVEDPSASPVVAMSATLDTDRFVVTASGLGTVLAPGEYWVGITPIAPSGPFGPEIHLASLTLIGDASASYDLYAFPGPPEWFNFNPGVDASILVEGTMGTTGTEETSWSGVKSLFR